MHRLLVTLGLILTIGATAQTTNSSTETSKTTSSSSRKNSESSITRSGESYQFEARYSKEKSDAVKYLLLDRLGTSYLKVNGGVHKWTKGKGGKEFFSCRLEDGEVRLSLDKRAASKDFYNLVDNLGDDLRDLVQEHKPHKYSNTASNPNSTDPQLYTEQLRQAERELARAKENLERLKSKD